MFTNEEKSLVDGFEVHRKSFDDHIMIRVKINEYDHVLQKFGVEK